MAQRQIINGSFQDGLGNALASGYITLRLSTDALVATNTQLYASNIINISLDSNGNVSGTVDVWPNDQMTPSTAVYVAKVFNSKGQLCWGPHGVTVPSGAGSYDISNWSTSVGAI